MRGVLSVGKVPADLLRELLGSGPPLPAEVRLGPSPGEDACAIAVPGGVLVAATDPITFTGQGIGRYAVLCNANDVAVMGVRPRWFLCTALLPEGTTGADVRDLFRELREALAGVGAALVGGHTEITPAVHHPVLVGQCLGLSPDGHFVGTGGASERDCVLQIGPAPVEGAAVLAAEATERIAAVPAPLLERARRAVEDPGISVVEPALEAAGLGATALHDATEGGLATALHELADASGIALTVDAGAVLWFEPGRAVCEALGADPWGTLASGTLLAAFSPARVAEAAERLVGRGWAVSRIATAAPGSGVRTTDGRPIPRFEPDEVARVLG